MQNHLLNQEDAFEHFLKCHAYSKYAKGTASSWVTRFKTGNLSKELMHIKLTECGYIKTSQGYILPMDPDFKVRLIRDINKRQSENPVHVTTKVKSVAYLDESDFDELLLAHLKEDVNPSRLNVLLLEYEDDTAYLLIKKEN